MRRPYRRLAIALLFVLTTPVLAGEPTPACYATALTQDDINQCAEQDNLASEGELQQLYRKIQLAYRDDPGFLQRLEASQQAWVQYRLAQLALRYPVISDADSLGDTADNTFPTCLNSYEAQLNRARIQALQPWLNGVEEGDLCCGSIRFDSPAEAPTEKNAPHE